MTNKEIKAMCIEQQSKRSNDYPKYSFKITQCISKVNDTILIYWEYLDGLCWTITIIEGECHVSNEHGEFMNYELEDTTNLEETIKSSVYYMTSRY